MESQYLLQATHWGQEPRTEVPKIWREADPGYLFHLSKPHSTMQTKAYIPHHLTAKTITDYLRFSISNTGSHLQRPFTPAPRLILATTPPENGVSLLFPISQVRTPLWWKSRFKRSSSIRRWKGQGDEAGNSTWTADPGPLTSQTKPRRHSGAYTGQTHL